MRTEARTGFRDGALHQIELEPLAVKDAGWVERCELFRFDDLDSLIGLPVEATPQTALFERWLHDVVTGPVQHRDQTNIFVFLKSAFRVYLWDMRRASPTVGTRHKYEVPSTGVFRLTLPPGVVYTLQSLMDNCLLLNFPTRLHQGIDRKEVDDEIRHDVEQRPFQLW